MSLRWQTVRRAWVATGLVATIWFVGWNAVAFRAHGVDPTVLEGSARIAVVADDNAIRFQPVFRRTSGLVFFPGALVDPVAYAPMARALAEQGFPVVIVRVPFLSSLIGWDEGTVMGRALAAVVAEPRTRWAIGGHSKGAVLAARLAATNAHWLSGVLLIGSTAPRDVDLSTLTLPVMKIVATDDGVAPIARVREGAARLPAATQWVEIAGGNHAQFGWYGPQLFDGRAAISRAEQQRQTVAAASRFLESLVQAP